MKSIITTLIKKPAFILVVALTWILTAACTKTEEPDPPAPEKVSRTVMVYIVANNNLGSGKLDYADLNEMRAAVQGGALDNGGRLLIYHEAYSQVPVLMEMKPAGVLDTLAVSPTGALGTDLAELRTALGNMRKFAPADSYGLVLWSHGTGWIEDGSERASSVSTLSFGSSAGHKMNVTDLAEVVTECDGVDFIHFDCCYMMGVEVVYELRHAASFISGSVTELPARGMPYDRTLAFLFSPDGPDLEAMAGATFDFYEHMTGQDRTCTVSIVRTDALDALARATAGLYSRCHTGIPDDVQRYSVTSPATCQYFDFEDYCERIADREDCVELLEDVKTALGQAVTYSVATPMLWDSFALERHCGLSTRILPSLDAAYDYRHYTSLQWWKDVASSLNDK